MYAVIETGGKQYRVELGTELEVELLDAQPGQEITLDRVLLVADGEDAAVGRPLVADASVHAEVLRQDRGEKLISFKYRPKARRRVKKGHRQELTVLRVTDLLHNGKSAAESAKKAEVDAKTERQRLEEAAARQAAEDAALAAKLAARSGPPSGTAAESTAETTSAPAPRRSRAKAAAQAAPVAPETAMEEGTGTVEATEPETASAPEAAASGEAVEAEPQVPAEEPPLTTENPEDAAPPATPRRSPRKTRKDE
jgi:large subunit ribosomal protein L21